MTIIEKILDWKFEQLKLGRDPKQIALSPWDEKELTEWVHQHRLLVHLMPLTRSPTRIEGLEIITTPEQ